MEELLGEGDASRETVMVVRRSSNIPSSSSRSYELKSGSACVKRGAIDALHTMIIQIGTHSSCYTCVHFNPWTYPEAS